MNFHWMCKRCRTRIDGADEGSDCTDAEVCAHCHRELLRLPNGCPWCKQKEVK